MAKQNKIKNKIYYESGQTTPLGTKPNDECYTSMQDIINELAKWSNKFRNKDIICPCDWDILEESDETKNVYSIKIEFSDSKMHGQTNSVMAISYSLFDYSLEDGNNFRTVKVSKSEIESFLKERVKCNFVRTFVENSSKWKIRSVTASGYNPATGKGIPFQNVDFKQYDLCVTNPPFSLYNEFISKLLESKIDFIVLAPFLNRVNPSVGLPLMLRNCYLGYGRDIHPNFYNPTAKNKYKTMVVACDWITSFNDAQLELNKNRLLTGIKYEKYKDDYKFMQNITMKDGTHPIKINKYTAIPDDYFGWMFCSIGALDKISFDEFEWYLSNAKGYFNSEKPFHSPFKHKIFDAMVMAQSYIDFTNLSQEERRIACKKTGESGFHGIVLRRLTNEKKG